jgi:hypothetical protein
MDTAIHDALLRLHHCRRTVQLARDAHQRDHMKFAGLMDDIIAALVRHLQAAETEVARIITANGGRVADTAGDTITVAHNDRRKASRPLFMLHRNANAPEGRRHAAPVH